MPPNKAAPGSPLDWLQRAKGDLAIAKMPLPSDACYEDLCFHAQQAAEKAVKAVFRYRGFAFRYTHDLERLLTELEGTGEIIPEDVRMADDLTTFAWETRTRFMVNPSHIRSTKQPSAKLKLWSLGQRK
ncbi:MAG: HEPN domain-containing protein [Magnetococcus sp. DMHC-1]|nr:HEPN domain-containing protein [Magnetococcales bacterium]